MLVIDDEPEVRDVLKDLLTAEGYLVIEARDGLVRAWDPNLPRGMVVLGAERAATHARVEDARATLTYRLKVPAGGTAAASSASSRPRTRVGPRYRTSPSRTGGLSGSTLPSSSASGDCRVSGP